MGRDITWLNTYRGVDGVDMVETVVMMDKKGRDNKGRMNMLLSPGFVLTDFFTLFAQDDAFPALITSQGLLWRRTQQTCMV